MFEDDIYLPLEHALDIAQQEAEKLENIITPKADGVRVNRNAAKDLSLQLSKMIEKVRSMRKFDLNYVETL